MKRGFENLDENGNRLVLFTAIRDEVKTKFRMELDLPVKTKYALCTTHDRYKLNRNYAKFSCCLWWRHLSEGGGMFRISWK